MARTSAPPKRPKITPKDYCAAQIPEGRPVTLTAQWPDDRTCAVETVVPPGKFNTWTLTK